MVHQVNFHWILDLCGQKTITDIWGQEHNIKDVDIILTKSMFKGFGWLKDSGMTWEDYWDASGATPRFVHHQCQQGETRNAHRTELSVLNTISIREDEFRPRDLPDGWDHSPEEDSRNWLTKQTEVAYYNFRAE